jgi:upstream activation factor subunit UAF30
MEGAQKRKVGIYRDLTVDENLYNVIKVKHASRGEIVKKIWEYIKKKDLQDKNNGRIFRIDSNLAKIFGNKSTANIQDVVKNISRHSR